jgi:hypothetical protein
MKNEYDLIRGMLNTVRNYQNNTKGQKKLFEQVDVNDNEDNDIDVINDVDVKITSTDENDLKLTDEQRSQISEIIDGFKSQVTQLVEFVPGFTINSEQIRLDGNLTETDINFVLIAGSESGVYINADMLKLDQTVGNDMEKLVKFIEVFKVTMGKIIEERKNN